nr:hypothetical protein Iba_chr14eCG7840 [Ipomoea batatas]
MTARATSSGGAMAAPWSGDPLPYITDNTLIAYSFPLPSILPITSTIISTASACDLTSAAPSSTVHSSSKAASALSATGPSKSDSASTTIPTAPTSTATRRFLSARQSARSTLLAGLAFTLSFKHPTTSLITVAGHSAPSAGFGTSDRSNKWIVLTLSVSEPVLNWSSATWNSSSKFAVSSGGGGGAAADSEEEEDDSDSERGGGLLEWCNGG